MNPHEALPLNKPEIPPDIQGKIDAALPGVREAFPIWQGIQPAMQFGWNPEGHERGMRLHIMDSNRLKTVHEFEDWREKYIPEEFIKAHVVGGTADLLSYLAGSEREPLEVLEWKRKNGFDTVTSERLKERENIPDVQRGQAIVVHTRNLTAVELADGFGGPTRRGAQRFFVPGYLTLGEALTVAKAVFPNFLELTLGRDVEDITQFGHTIDLIATKPVANQVNRETTEPPAGVEPAIALKGLLAGAVERGDSNAWAPAHQDTLTDTDLPEPAASEAPTHPDDMARRFSQIYKDIGSLPENERQTAIQQFRKDLDSLKPALKDHVVGYMARITHVYDAIRSLPESERPDVKNLWEDVDPVVFVGMSREQREHALQQLEQRNSMIYPIRQLRKIVGLERRSPWGPQ